MKCNRQCFAVPWFLQFHQTLHFRAREQVTVGGPPHFSIPQEDHSWQSRRCRPMEVIFRSSKVLSKYSQTNLHSHASRHVPFPVLTIPNMVGRKLCLKPSKASKRIPSEADWQVCIQQGIDPFVQEKSVQFGSHLQKKLMYPIGFHSQKASRSNSCCAWPRCFVGTFQPRMTTNLTGAKSFIPINWNANRIDEVYIAGIEQTRFKEDYRKPWKNKVCLHLLPRFVCSSVDSPSGWIWFYFFSSDA